MYGYNTQGELISNNKNNNKNNIEKFYNEENDIEENNIEENNIEENNIENFYDLNNVDRTIQNNKAIASEQVNNVKLPPMKSYTAVTSEVSKITNENFLNFAPAISDTHDTQAPFYDQRVFRTFWF